MAVSTLRVTDGVLNHSLLLVSLTQSEEIPSSDVLFHLLLLSIINDPGMQNLRKRGNIAPRHFLLKDEKWWQVEGGR